MKHDSQQWKFKTQYRAVAAESHLTRKSTWEQFTWAPVDALCWVWLFFISMHNYLVCTCMFLYIKSILYQAEIFRPGRTCWALAWAITVNFLVFKVTQDLTLTWIRFLATAAIIFWFTTNDVFGVICILIQASFWLQLSDITEVMAWRRKASISAVLLEKHRLCPLTNASDLT